VHMRETETVHNILVHDYHNQDAFYALLLVIYW